MKNNRKIDSCCEMCSNYCLDEEINEYYCMVNLDEDEYLNFLRGSSFSCPYFRPDDEYEIVKHQN